MIGDPVVAVVGLLATAAFMAVFMVSGIIAVAGSVIDSAQAAASTMRDPNADDDVREKAMQAAAKDLFGAFAGIIVRSGIALLAAGAVIYAAGLAGMTSFDSVVNWLSRWDVIIAMCVVITASWMAARRLWPSR